MKNLKMLTLVLCLFLTTLAFSQKLGIMAGPNFSLISPNFSEDFTIFTGYHVGSTVEVDFNDRMSVNGSLLYSVKGDKLKHGDGIVPDSELKINYLDVPVRFKYLFGQKILKPFLAAGPYLGYAISGKSTMGTQTEAIDSKKFESHYRRVDSGIGFGAGLSGNNLSFEFIFETSFVEFRRAPGNTSKFQNLVTSVSYLF